MNRIATRTFVLLVSGLLALGTASACASEDTTTTPFRTLDAGHLKPDAAHACNLAYCPQPTTGKACCLGTACGVDPGTGCVPFNKKDGG